MYISVLYYNTPCVHSANDIPYSVILRAFLATFYAETLFIFHPNISEFGITVASKSPDLRN